MKRHGTHDRPVVLIGNVDPMVQLSMSRLFTDQGVDHVHEDHAGAIVAQAERLAPGTVVLSLEEERTDPLGAQVRVAAPAAKIILWARDEREMEVYDPGSLTPRRIGHALPDALIREVSTPTNVGED